MVDGPQLQRCGQARRDRAHRLQGIDPVLRSRGGINSAARQLSEDPKFQAWAKRLLKEGVREVRFPGFGELAQQVRALQAKVEALEAASRRPPLWPRQRLLPRDLVVQFPGERARHEAGEGVGSTRRCRPVPR